MFPPWNLDAIAAGVTEAATSPGRWKTALETLSEHVGATGAILLPSTGRHKTISTDSVASTTERYIKEGWHTRDLRDRGIRTLLRTGIMVDQDFVSESEMRESEYYNDFLGRSGLRWFAGLAVQTGDELWVISIQRTPEQGPFSSEEQACLRLIRSQFNSAAVISREMSLARSAGFANAFDLMGTAAVVVDQRGQVIRLNRAAETTLTSDLRITQGKLVAKRHSVTLQIEHLIGRVTGSDASAGLETPVVVPRLGKQPLVVYAAPLLGEAVDLFSQACAVVIIRDLESRSVPGVEQLRQLFRLTLAEAKLAERLAQGDSLSLAADALGICRETARSQLKSIFAKTDSCRQSELVGLMLRLMSDQPRS